MKNLSEFIDVEATEAKLLRIATECFVDYANKHTNVQFHSLVFDINISYGEVLLSAESYSAFSQRMLKWRNHTLFDPLTQRWASGDFDHDLFSENYASFQEWENNNKKEIANAMDAAYELYRDNDSEWFDFKNQAKQMISRVAKRLYDSEAIVEIKKSPDFFVLAFDHDEDELEALNRQIAINY